MSRSSTTSRKSVSGFRVCNFTRKPLDRLGLLDYHYQNKLYRLSQNYYFYPWEFSVSGMINADIQPELGIYVYLFQIMEDFLMEDFPNSQIK
jgi:hypothetical protein